MKTSRPGTDVPSERFSSKAPAAVLLIGLLLTPIAAFSARANIRHVDELELASDAERARTAVELRLTSNAEVLFGLRGLLATHSGVNRAQFHRYVEESGILRRYPGVRAVSFNRIVRARDIASFERSVREDRSLLSSGYPNFRVQPRGSGEDLIVIDFVEPLAGNELAFGFNLAMDPTRMDAIIEARDGGDLTATAPLQLVQTGNPSGFLLFLAVYDTAYVPESAPARRRHFEGLLAVAYESSAMLADALGASPGVRVERIYDVGRTVDSNVLPFDESRLVIVPGKQSLGGKLHRTLDLDAGSRRWRMEISGVQGDRTFSTRYLPWIVSLSGVLFSAMLAAVLFSFGRSRTKALELAGAMTADLRDRERDLETANRNLENSNSAIHDFVAIASHDMRTPLAALLGSARILSGDNGSLSDENRRRAIEIIVGRAEQLSRLADDLLTTSQIDAGGLVPIRDQFSLKSALEEIIDAAAKPVTLSCPAGLEVVVDRDHLFRIVSNLLDNALKYGSPPVDVEADVEGPFVRVFVTDRGGGVPAELVPRLFDKFARGSLERVRTLARGTGLGLAIVRGLAEANGGDVSYKESNPSGARFCVRLPLAPESGPDAPQPVDQQRDRP